MNNDDADGRGYKRTLNVRLTSEECDRLRTIAARRGADGIAGVIRQAVRQFIAAESAGQPAEGTHGASDRA